MTTVAEHMAWSTHKTTLKTYLGVSGTDEDTLLELWTDTVIEVADTYLERDFRPQKLRFKVKSGFEVGDVFTITVNGLAASYTVAAGDVAADIAEGLYDALDVALSGEDVSTVWRYDAVEIEVDDYDDAMTYSTSYTPIGEGTSGFTATIKYTAPPKPVETAVYEGIKAVRERWRRRAAVTSAHTGAVGETFSQTTVGQIALEVMASLLAPYKENILTGVGVGS